MAEVYRATTLGIGGFEKELAIKRILPHLVNKQDFVEMFINEAKLSALLHHSNIVQIFDLGEIEGIYYIAMEYIQGVDLSILLQASAEQGNPLPLEVSLLIGSELLSGLGFAHRALSTSGEPLGIVHRDVSPHNVLISAEGEVKVVDFGIARAAQGEGQTRAGMLKGKVGYMSPEQVCGRDLDNRSDVFSAGIVLYEMLSSSRLFAHATELDTLMAIKNADVPPLTSKADLPEELSDIVLKALRANAGERYQTAEEFREALMDFAFTAGVRPRKRDLPLVMAKRLPDRLKAKVAVAKAPTVDIPIDIGDMFSSPRSETPPPQPPPSMSNETNGEAKYRISDGTGRVLGPVSIGTIKDLIQTSRITGRERVSRDTGKWRNISAYGEINELLPAKTGVTEPTTGVKKSTFMGTLAQISLTKLLYRFHVTRETGRLHIKSKSVEKEVFLRFGIPEYVTSNIKGELLGEYLVKEGVITRRQLHMAVLMLGSQGRLGDALVSQKILAPHQLSHHLSMQAQAKIIEAFTWTEGNYSFFRGEKIAQGLISVDIRTISLIVRGVRESFTAQRLFDLFVDKMDMEVYHLDNPHTRFSDIPLTGPEMRVLKEINNSRNLFEVLQGASTGGSDGDAAVLRVIYLLQELDMIILSHGPPQKGSAR